MASLQQVVLLLIYIGLCLLVGVYARSYLRSRVVWFVLSLLFTPLVAFVFLLAADVPHAAVVFKQKVDAVRDRHGDKPESDLKALAAGESQCPNCSAPINTVTEEGLHSHESKQWLFLCDRCDREMDFSS